MLAPFQHWSPARYWGLVAALAAVWFATLALGAGRADERLLLALYAGGEPWLALTAIWFTYLGNWWTVVGVTIAVAAWMAWRGRYLPAVVLLFVTFTGRGLVILAKEIFGRLRPEEHLRLVEVHYLSFPSGHSANAMMVYVSIALLAFEPGRARDRAVALTLLLAFLVGISRPMLGVHWPSDVVGGWSFGAFWLLVVLASADRFANRNQTLKRNSITSPS